MRKIQAIIERAEDGTYAVRCDKEIFSGMGDTVEEAKKDMATQMAFYKETAIKEGFKYPAFLDGEFEVEYSFDILSVTGYYIKKGYFSLATLSKITGISQKQLWSYANGTRPRKAQADRIRDGLMSLSNDLDAIFA